MRNDTDYCKDAKKLLGIKVVCGSECPILKHCPRLILEDAISEAISEAIKAMFWILKEAEEKK